MKLPELMSGMVLTGHGGLDKLQWRDNIPVPKPEHNEVLVEVLASSVNNTDINTRIAWYSKSVRGDTASASKQVAEAAEADGAWSGEPLVFPRIQGADCCGRIVAVGSDVPESRIGERVLLRAMQTFKTESGELQCRTLGSESDGAFAQYTKVSSFDALPVNSDWTDEELASIPCAYSTAEGMLQRIALGAERVLITGASGGVGSAAVQLAKRRGAHVAAMINPSKAKALGDIGADETVGRDDPFPKDSFDAVVDLTAGPRWPDMITALRRGGRYVASGAIAGPLVELDVRTLYLRDLSLFGSTLQPDRILPDVISYIERGELKPLIAREFPLKELQAAQTAFLKKDFVGKIAIRHV
ncbi:alcohol dehydrogenase family protein [Limibacillus sp. MBR-115]|jgi:NADPH:quinone reductase-like Zn-dependent oxidoreductase|uniref:alcohol dehydrogenase family protein n=1 Tax=Limibacillus sp. MBR-115 TaxID=3156465 RepID=UPI0033988B68